MFTIIHKSSHLLDLTQNYSINNSRIFPAKKRHEHAEVLQSDKVRDILFGRDSLKQHLQLRIVHLAYDIAVETKNVIAKRVSTKYLSFICDKL